MISSVWLPFVIRMIPSAFICSSIRILAISFSGLFPELHSTIWNPPPYASSSIILASSLKNGFMISGRMRPIRREEFLKRALASIFG